MWKNLNGLAMFFSMNVWDSLQTKNHLSCKQNQTLPPSLEYSQLAQNKSSRKGVFLNHFQHKKILIEKGCAILKFIGTSWGLGLRSRSSFFRHTQRLRIQNIFMIIIMIKNFFSLKLKPVKGHRFQYYGNIKKIPFR